jgi:hypothetical protein
MSNIMQRKAANIASNGGFTVAYYPPLPLYHNGILMAAFFGRVTFAVMCRASCRRGAVWTANSDKSTKTERHNWNGLKRLELHF